MSVTLHSAQVIGLDAQPIAVEVDITPGLHLFSIVGLADKEVQESRERISAAIKNTGALPPHKKSQRVIVNLAPADIKKEGPAFDLPIALGYLLASRQIAFAPAGTLFLGELGLDGGLRKVAGVVSMAIAARASGFSTIILPKGNGAEAALIEGITAHEAESLAEVIEHLSGRKELPCVPKTAPVPPPQASSDIRDIRGQETAKRALAIAAAGGHNILFFGPPGAGKTILARALPSLLPPLSPDEMLEVMKIHSASGALNAQRPFVAERPFRSPHHTSSHTAVIGGGAYPRPGEATLAHRGVLFLDEFPEFDRRVIESLRQPLEERVITVARTQGTQTFPAHFIFVAAMNPCPCGNFGNPKHDCICSSGAVLRYRKKISGPIIDRIDLHVEMPPVDYQKLRQEPSEAEEESSKNTRARVIRARAAQARRFRGSGLCTNAEMGIRELKNHIHISESVHSLFERAHERWRLTARSYHRLLKLARTIADLDESDAIREEHVSEALRYRPKQEV